MTTDKAFQALSNALNLPEIIPPAKTTVLVPDESAPPSSLSQDAQKDYKLARRKLKKVLKVGTEALDGMHEVAKADESARSYEVVATLMRAVADTTADLYAIHEKTQKMAGTTPSKSGNIEIEKAVFVGSPSEMLDKIKGNANKL